MKIIQNFSQIQLWLYFALAALNFTGLNGKSLKIDFKTLLLQNISKYSFCFVAALCVVLSAFNIIAVEINPNSSIFFGGFSKFVAIEHNINIQKALFIFSINLIALFYSIICLDENSHKGENSKEKKTKSTALSAAIIGAFVGIIQTNDIFNLYVFIEISSICLYTSAFLNNNKQCYKAGLSYLIYGSLASCLIIFAIILLYATTGQLNITLISQVVNGGQNGGNLKLYPSQYLLIKASFWLFVIASFIKMGLPPFQNWLINFYCKTDILFTSLSAPLSTKMFVFIMLNLVATIYKIFAIKFNILVIGFLVPIIVIANFYALMSRNILKIISYSSISNTCFFLLSFCISNNFYKPLIILVLGDAFLKFILFASISLMQKNNNENNINKIISTTPRRLKIVFLISFFILSSLPPSPMFFAKINIMLSCLSEGYYFSFGLLILANILTICYFVKIILALLFNKKQNKTEVENVNFINIVAFKILIAIYLSISICVFKYGL